MATVAGDLPADPSSAGAAQKAIYTAHEVGTYNLKRAMRPVGAAIALFLLAAWLLGLAVGRGGWIGLLLDAVVMAVMGGCWVADRIGLLGDHWMRGFFGEAFMSHILGMLPESYAIYHDVTVSSNGEVSNIDHLVVGPTGIWVIETKAWRGQIARSGEQLFLSGFDHTNDLKATVAKAVELRRELEARGHASPFVKALLVTVSARVPDGHLEFPNITLVGASDVLSRIRPGRPVVSRDLQEAIASMITRR